MPVLRLRLLAAVAVLAGFGHPPATARAAPKPGLWVAERGDIRMGFIVARERSGLVLRTATIGCRGSFAGEWPSRFTNVEPRRYRVTNAGRVPKWPRRIIKPDYSVADTPAPAPRLGRTRGRISVPEGYACSAKGLDLPVRRRAAGIPRDGTWTVVSARGWTTEFTVYGGGLTLLDGGGDYAIPDPGGDADDVCILPVSVEGTSIERDGSFTARDAGQFPGASPGPSSTLTGRFSGATTASGTFSTEQRGDCGIFTGTEGGSGTWSATLTEPADNGLDPRPSPSPKPPPAPTEPKPKPGTGYGAPPTPSKSPGCTDKVTAGELEALASCWTTDGDVATARGRVRVNGIDLTPVRAADGVRIDRRTQRISTTGPVDVRVGGVRLLRARLDWRSRKVTFSTKDAQKLLGLALDGSAELTFAGGKTALKLTVKIPDDPRLRVLRGFTGWSGELTAAATNDQGLVLDAVDLTFPSLRVGWIDIVNASLKGSRASTSWHWDGGATIYPFKTSLGLIGVIGWGRTDDYFKLGGGFEQLNRPLVYGVFLQKGALTFQRSPFGVSGAVGATLGPQFRLGDDLISSARFDGGISYLTSLKGDPSTIEMTGALEIREAKVADGKLTIAGGKVDVSGNADFTLADYGVKGNMAGWFDGLRAYDLEGRTTVSLPGPDQTGEALFSTRGVAACRRGFGPDVGFGYRWGEGLGGLDVFARSCDVGGWREVRSTRASRAPEGFVVPRGTRTIVVRVDGQGGAPAVAFAGPGGRRVTPGPDGSFSDARTLLIRDPATAAAYLAIDRPARGRWRIEPVPGSIPVRRTRVARSLPRPQVRASVHRGNRGTRVLRYRIRRRGGARVRFLEVGRRSRRALGTGRRRAGRLRFRPAAGPGGVRRIVAVTERFGHPLARARVGRFRSHPVRPARPRRLRVARRGTARIVRWRGGGGGRFEVLARTSDGRRLRYLRRPGRRRVRIGLVPRGVRVRVRVRSISATGVVSRPRRGVSR